MIYSVRFFWLLILLLLLVSCGNKDKQEASPSEFTPDSVIDQSKMVCIMVDVHITEAALVIQRNEGVVSREKSEFLYHGIFSKYHISRGRYEANLRYYSLNPELFEKMYGRVIRILEEQQKQFIPGN